MLKLKADYKFAMVILFMLGLFNVLNGLFHFWWFDSGAGSVAGMDISSAAGKNVVFMLAVIGELQVVKGSIYILTSLKEKQYILLMFIIEFFSQVATLWLQYGPKHPDPLAPHRYGNILFAIMSAAVIVILILLERQKTADENS